MSKLRSYQAQTTDHPSLLTRCAHTHSLGRSLDLILRLGGTDPEVIDYGCGKGLFVQELLRLGVSRAVGYEPFMTQDQSLPYVFNDKHSIQQKKYDIVTLLEAIEHLSENELFDFFSFCSCFMKKNGKILISAPIEIGPALFVKDLTRAIFFRRRLENTPAELVKAGLLGIPVPRSSNIKGSHKGYDFRVSISEISRQYGKVRLLGYGPLPIGSWYGNSQVYFEVIPYR